MISVTNRLNSKQHSSRSACSLSSTNASRVSWRTSMTKKSAFCTRDLARKVKATPHSSWWIPWQTMLPWVATARLWLKTKDWVAKIRDSARGTMLTWLSGRKFSEAAPPTKLRTLLEGLPGEEGTPWMTSPKERAEKDNNSISSTYRTPRRLLTWWFSSIKPVSSTKPKLLRTSMCKATLQIWEAKLQIQLTIIYNKPQVTTLTQPIIQTNIEVALKRPTSSTVPNRCQDFPSLARGHTPRWMWTDRLSRLTPTDLELSARRLSESSRVTPLQGRQARLRRC